MTFSASLALFFQIRPLGFLEVVRIKGKNESVKDYFSRVLSPLQNEKRGLIFQPAGDGEWSEPDELFNLWHSLQDGRG